MHVLGVDPLEWALIAVGLGFAAIICVRRITRGPPRYAPATRREKAICLILLVAILSTWAVHYGGWRWFGGYEKQAAVIVTMIGVLYVTRLAAILERQ